MLACPDGPTDRGQYQAELCQSPVRQLELRTLWGPSWAAAPRNRPSWESRLARCLLAAGVRRASHERCEPLAGLRGKRAGGIAPQQPSTLAGQTYADGGPDRLLSCRTGRHEVASGTCTQVKRSRVMLGWTGREGADKPASCPRQLTP